MVCKEWYDADQYRKGSSQTADLQDEGFVNAIRQSDFLSLSQNCTKTASASIDGRRCTGNY
jgi:hypothetical protein